MTDVCRRYFFCLRPAPALAARIGRFRDSLRCEGTIVADNRLHVTLGITDDFPEPSRRIADYLKAVGGLIDSEPFSLQLDRLSSNGRTMALRPSRRPPQLGLLQRRLDRWMVRSGLKRGGWTFSPHSTLIYRAGDAFLHPIKAFNWAATELVLVHSIVGETRHVEIGRWPLIRRQLELAL